MMDPMIQILIMTNKSLIGGKTYRVFFHRAYLRGRHLGTRRKPQDRQQNSSSTSTPASSFAKSCITKVTPRLPHKRLVVAAKLLTTAQILALQTATVHGGTFPEHVASR